MFVYVLVMVAMATSIGPVTDVKAAVRMLESRYAHARTLKASFFERYSDGKGTVQSESGTVYFSRPGRFVGTTNRLNKNCSSWMAPTLGFMFLRIAQ